MKGPAETCSLGIWTRRHSGLCPFDPAWPLQGADPWRGLRPLLHPIDFPAKFDQSGQTPFARDCDTCKLKVAKHVSQVIQILETNLNVIDHALRLTILCCARLSTGSRLRPLTEWLDCLRSTSTSSAVTAVHATRSAREACTLYTVNFGRKHSTTRTKFDFTFYSSFNFQLSSKLQLLKTRAPDLAPHRQGALFAWPIALL